MEAMNSCGEEGWRVLQSNTTITGGVQRFEQITDSDLNGQYQNVLEKAIQQSSASSYWEQKRNVNAKHIAISANYQRVQCTVSNRLNTETAKHQG